MVGYFGAWIHFRPGFFGQVKLLMSLAVDCSGLHAIIQPVFRRKWHPCMGDTASRIHIKGLRDGLLVTLEGETWEQCKADLLAQIDERQSFFEGGRLALDVGAHALAVNELSAFRDLLSDRNIMLWAVLSESPKTEKTAQLLGLATRISRPRPEDTAPQSVEIPKDTALWIARTLRSGARIQHVGNVVVLGDVNPGAEIISDGSVLVWGRLRGVVHAGAQGDQTAVVCALDLAPTQLRIAGEIAVMPEGKHSPTPEVVCLKDGRISAEPWQPGS
jgi:septum site-determining protein MinC